MSAQPSDIAGPPAPTDAGALFAKPSAKYLFLFDGSCGLCQKTVWVIDRLNLLERVQIVDVLSTWPALSKVYPSLDFDQCLKDIHLVRKDGKISSGFEAYRTLAWSLPLLWLIVPFLYVPGVPQIGRRVYRRIADNRHATGCALPPQGGPPIPAGADAPPQPIAVSRKQQQMSWAFQALACFFLFFLIEPILHGCGRIFASMYSSPVLIFEATKYKRPWALILLSLLPLIFWRQYRWTSSELGSRIRWIIGLIAVTLALPFSTYSYNYFFDQPHYFDRGLLAALAMGTFVHPFFLPLFLLQIYIVTGQFNHPAPMAFTWTDKILLYQLLGIAVAMLPLKLFNRRIGWVPYFIVAVAAIASFYLLPGIGKLKMEWLQINQTSNIIKAAHFQNGWLKDPEVYQSVLKMAAATDWLLKPTTLFIELAMVLVFFRRWVAVLMFICAAGFHIGIFVSSGIFFWKWVVVELALVCMILTIPRSLAGSMFNGRQVAIAACFVAMFSFWSSRVVNLAWYDTNLAFHFNYEAVGKSGKRYEVPPYLFAPYDLPFAKGRFYFLTDRPQMVDCLGATWDKETLMNLRECDSPDEFVDVHRQFGKSAYHEKSVRDFDLLTQRYFAWRNRGNRVGSPTGWLAAPYHISSNAVSADPRSVYDAQETIERVDVRLQEALTLENGDYAIVFDDIVHSVPIPDASTAPAEQKAVAP